MATATEPPDIDSWQLVVASCAFAFSNPAANCLQHPLGGLIAQLALAGFRSSLNARPWFLGPARRFWVFRQSRCIWPKSLYLRRKRLHYEH